MWSNHFFLSSFHFLKISFTFTYFLFIFLIFCRLLLDSSLYKPHAYDAKCCFRPFWMVVDAAFALLLFQFIWLMMFRLYFFFLLLSDLFQTNITSPSSYIFCATAHLLVFSLNLSLTFRFHFYHSTIQALFELSLQQLCFSQKRLTPRPIHFSSKPFKILFTFTIEIVAAFFSLLSFLLFCDEIEI